MATAYPDHWPPLSELTESPQSKRRSRRNPTHNGQSKPRPPINNYDFHYDSNSGTDSETSDSTSSFSDISFNSLEFGLPLHLRRPPDPDGAEDDSPMKAVEVPPFPIGNRVCFRETCIVCLIDSCNSTLYKPRYRACCGKFVCSPCLEEYCSVKVLDGVVHIGCPNDNCTRYLHRDEIAFHLKDGPLKAKFYKYLIDANKDPLTKTCPRCCNVMKIKASELKQSKKKGLKKTCAECDLVWCFPCQAPWHENMTCRQYCAGDRLVSEWAKEVHYGSRNAQKCPKCAVYIERTEGCDHMSCGYCQTDFCYRCGGRYRSLRFLGSHHSRYSVFGCKYYLKPNKPAQRIIIRSSVLGGKILAVPALVTLGVALLPFAVMAGAVVAPVYGGMTLHRYLKRRSLRRKTRRVARGERPPVVLLRVTPHCNRRTGVPIPLGELTSHFESELDSTQMSEIRADLDDLHLETLVTTPSPLPEPDTERPRLPRFDNSNGRERVRPRHRRGKLFSRFEKVEKIDEKDFYGLIRLFHEPPSEGAVQTSVQVYAATSDADVTVDVKNDVESCERQNHDFDVCENIGVEVNESYDDATSPAVECSKDVDSDVGDVGDVGDADTSCGSKHRDEIYGIRLDHIQMEISV